MEELIHIHRIETDSSDSTIVGLKSIYILEWRLRFLSESTAIRITIFHVSIYFHKITFIVIKFSISIQVDNGISLKSIKSILKRVPKQKFKNIKFIKVFKRFNKFALNEMKWRKQYCDNKQETYT